MVIGRITLWQPPQRLAYTWRDPSWTDDTSIQLAFGDFEAGARVVYRQSGFAGAGVEWLIPYYRVGCAQTLSGYVAHCRALRAVQELGLRLD